MIIKVCQLGLQKPMTIIMITIDSMIRTKTWASSRRIMITLTSTKLMNMIVTSSDSFRLQANFRRITSNLTINISMNNRFLIKIWRGKLMEAKSISGLRHHLRSHSEHRKRQSYQVISHRCPSECQYHLRCHLRLRINKMTTP